MKDKPRIDEFFVMASGRVNDIRHQLQAANISCEDEPEIFRLFEHFRLASLDLLGCTDKARITQKAIITANVHNQLASAAASYLDEPTKAKPAVLFQID